MDEEGNIIPGKQIDMIVDGNEVYIVRLPFTNQISERTHPTLSRNLVEPYFHLMKGLLRLRPGSELGSLRL